MTEMDTSTASQQTDQSPVGTSVVFDGRYMAPPEDSNGRLWVRTSAIVQSSPQELYERWRDIESAPEWSEQTVSAHRTGETTSSWVIKIGDHVVQWNSEILADEPGKRIAWRSTGGDLDEAGEVVFEAAVGGRGTAVTWLQEYRMGKLESAWQTLVGRNPKQAIIESLRHFKALAETGEIPRIEGQPHGPRGAAAKAKRSAYGETVPTPPGEMRRAS